MKIRDLRVLIGAAALATAGTSAGFAFVAVTSSVSTQASNVCEGYTVLGNGKMICRDFGTSTACVPFEAGPDGSPYVTAYVCVPD